MKQCKDNENESQFIPLDMKNNIKRMATEQGLYAQVVKLRRKYLKLITENKNKNQVKFKFQGLSARSQRWFDLDFDWFKVNFSTRRPDLYNIFFKDMTIHKIQILSKCFRFQWEMKNMWNHLSFTIMPESSSIVRSH